MSLLEGKRALIVGVASKRSIAWGIAQAMFREGAELAFTYQGERMKPRVESLAGQCDCDIIVPCDVQDDAQIEAVFEHLDNYWDHLDILVHSVAFAPKDELEGDFLDNMTRDGFRTAHDISSYSFAALAKAGRQMMHGRNGAMLTLTYIGSIRAMPNYNVMGLAKASLEANVRYLAYTLGGEGIRVNAVAPTFARTQLTAPLLADNTMAQQILDATPMGRFVEPEEVAAAIAFLCSDAASMITGAILPVDGGWTAR